MTALGGPNTYTGPNGDQRDAVGIFGQVTASDGTGRTAANPNANGTTVSSRRNVTPAADTVTTLAAVAVPNGVFVRAQTGNSGVVYVGGADVGTNGFPLAAGQGVSLSVANTSAVALYRPAATVTGLVDWIAS